MIRFLIGCLGALTPLPLTSIQSLGAISPHPFALDSQAPAREAVRVHGNESHSTYDLVEKVQYLFVRIVKAQALPLQDSITGAPADPFVKIRVSENVAKTRTSPKTGYLNWDQVFAFDKEKLLSAPEISVWDEDIGTRDDFLDRVYFDLSEVLMREPPNSSLAPQWYRLEGDGKVKGDIMLAVWIGMQADEAFPEASQRHNDTDLHLAVKNGELEGVKALLNACDDAVSLVIEVNELGEKPLYVVAERGHLEVLKDVAANRKDCEQQMDLVGKIRHRNLVPLRAFYFSKDEKLLVYDYMPSGSLSALLHSSRGSG